MNKNKEREIKKTSVKIPSLENFLKAGAHFGHKTSAWDPKMEEYVYDQRDGIHIIDLIKTMQCLKDALARIEDVVDFGNVLIVGTKGQAASVVTRVAEETGAFYINNRWPGGLFTNFKIIKKGLDRLMKLEETLASGGGEATKREQLMMQREVDRLNRIYSGIKMMEKLPKLVIVVDSKVEKIAIRESSIVGVPVVALLDTNCDPTLVDYPIPANDDSIKSITLFVDLLGEAIRKGKKSQLLLAMRKNYYAQLESGRKAYENKIVREKAMQEEEKSRIKRLRLRSENLEKQEEKKVETKAAQEKVVKKEQSKKLEKEILDLDLGSRVEKALLDGEIYTLKDLKTKTKEELLSLKGLGEKAVEKIMDSI
jgi:small subunit ribosomal protein S2